MFILQIMFFIFVMSGTSSFQGKELPIADDEDLCALQACTTPIPTNSSMEEKCVVEKGLMMKGRCCINLTSDQDIFGVDLSHCNVTSLGNLLTATAPLIVKLNLTFNPHITFNENTFKGLHHLKVLSIPPGMDCPGNNQSWLNTPWQAWNKTEFHKNVTVCSIQTDTCTLLSKHNYTCPKHSQCNNNGPGMFNCTCLPGWGGYKCMRTVTHKPTLYIITGTLASSVVMSSLLWYTERRFVINR